MAYATMYTYHYICNKICGIAYAREIITKNTERFAYNVWVAGKVNESKKEDMRCLLPSASLGVVQWASINCLSSLPCQGNGEEQRLISLQWNRRFKIRSTAGNQFI